MMIYVSKTRRIISLYVYELFAVEVTFIVLWPATRCHVPRENQEKAIKNMPESDFITTIDWNNVTTFQVIE